MEISEIIKLDWVNEITNRISVVRKESWAVPLAASPKTFPQHLAGKHASFIYMQPMDFSQTPHTVFYYCCYIRGWIQTTPIGNCKQKARQKSPCPSRDWPSPSPSCLILKVAQTEEHPAQRPRYGQGQQITCTSPQDNSSTLWFWKPTRSRE